MSEITDFLTEKQQARLEDEKQKVCAKQVETPRRHYCGQELNGQFFCTSHVGLSMSLDGESCFGASLDFPDMSSNGTPSFNNGFGFVPSQPESQAANMQLSHASQI